MKFKVGQHVLVEKFGENVSEEEQSFGFGWILGTKEIEDKNYYFVQNTSNIEDTENNIELWLSEEELVSIIE